MKLFKKVISIALASLLVCTAVTGCGGRSKTDISGAKSIADLKGATIGAQTGTFHLTALDQIEGVIKKDYADFTDLLNALKSGAIDGYVAEEPTAYDVCAKDATLKYLPFVNNSTGFKASESETGIAVAFKTGSDMVEKVNAIIAKIPAEVKSELMQQMVEISNKTDSEYGKELALVSKSTDTSKGTLKIAMECAYAPFNWTQTTNTNGAVPIQGKNNLYANGYDVQIAKYIASELGMKLEVYAYEWDSLIPAVQSGSVDGIIAGMSPTEEREKEVDFTDCYYNSNLVVIYKK
jgi:ABC-type amino acid transport substrate-binding protein